jgi:pyruvate dehydrogenase E1 component alpha subunit
VSTLFDYTYATPVPNDSRRLPGDPLFDQLPFPAAPAAAGTVAGAPAGVNA